MEEKLNDLIKDNKQLEKIVDELNEVSSFEDLTSINVYTIHLSI